jgi:hypothetical protein
LPCLLLLLAAILAVPGLGSPPVPKILTEDFASSFAVKPPRIIVSGDGSAIIAGTAAWIGRNPRPNVAASQFGSITWITWKATGASGLGQYWLDNCKPNCAQGTYFPRTVVIDASRAQHGLFTRLAISPTGAKPRIFTLLSHPGFDGDFDARLCLAEGEVLSHATSQEVSDRVVGSRDAAGVRVGAPDRACR